MRYDLDADAARKANTSSRIEESGKYIGTFTRAEMVTSQKGTVGVEFAFESEHKQTADYLTIWTVNKDNQRIYGYNILMAIMTCLGVRTLETEKAVINKWDSVAKQEVPTEAVIYPELMNKRIGVLLQIEEYKNGHGDIKEKAALFAPFQASTEFTASEILDRKVSPEKLAGMVASLQPLKKLKASGGSSAPSGGGAPDFDEIPFNQIDWRFA